MISRKDLSTVTELFDGKNPSYKSSVSQNVLGKKGVKLSSQVSIC